MCPRALRENPAKSSHVHPSGPEHSPRRQALHSAAVFTEREALRVDLGDHDTRAGANAQPDERSLGVGREALGERHQHAWGAIQKKDPRLGGIDRAEVMLERFAGDFAERAREFYPCWAGANHHECQPGPPLVYIGCALGGFERVQNLVPDGRGFFHALQAGREDAPLIVAEIEALRSGCDNQRVVVERRAVVKDHFACPRIQVRDIAQQDARIFLPAENTAQRCTHIAGREGARGHLIEQRLEEMKVAAVEKGDLDRRLPQRPRGV